MRNINAHSKTSRDPYSVAVLDKAINVLTCLTDGKGWSVTRLSEVTGMTKTSVYRIVSTLQRRGYLSREASERVFIAGPALLAFARLLIGNTALTALAHPILQDLHEELGETINLAILDRHRILYVDMVESAQGLRMAAQVGTSGSVYSTALGKAILADLPRDQARKILTSVERPAYTANTKTGIADLMHELDAVKAHGWALDDEENEVGARCIGVAVRDSAGMSIGAISASGPAWRLPDEKVAGVGTVLQGAALRIEEQCGYKHVKSTSGATRSNAVSRSGRSRD